MEGLNLRGEVKGRVEGKVGGNTQGKIVDSGDGLRRRIQDRAWFATLGHGSELGWQVTGVRTTFQKTSGRLDFGLSLGQSRPMGVDH